jgi:hypothetical protein
VTLSRPQRDLLRQLVFRWPHPCYLVITGRGQHALVVSTMMRSRCLERMSHGFMRATTVGLAEAGLITLVERFLAIPRYGYRQPDDSDHGWLVGITAAGRAAIGAVTEAQQRRAQAISATELAVRGAEAQARATRVARGEAPGDARPVHPAGGDPVLAELQGAHGVGGDFGWAAFLPTARDYLGSEPSEPTSDTLLTILDVLCAVTGQAKRRGLPLMVVARGDDREA